jgi:hypothetical protein
MFEFSLVRRTDYTLLHICGDVVDNDDVELLSEALVFVLPDDHLVLDLSGVNQLSASGAILIHDNLIRRAVIAETAVVSSHESVSMQLVLHDVDRVSPIVHTIADAQDILDKPWTRRRQPH